MTDCENLIRICRENHLKVTPQRIAVYKMLAENRTHPTVEQVFLDVRNTIKSISLDTVYRILNSFSEIGLIRRLNHGSAVRYDGNPEEHHHFSCRECGTIYDVELPNLNIDAGQHAAISQIDGMELSLHGLCSKCATCNSNGCGTSAVTA